MEDWDWGGVGKVCWRKWEQRGVKGERREKRSGTGLIGNRAKRNKEVRQLLM